MTLQEGFAIRSRKAANVRAHWSGTASAILWPCPS